MTRGLFFTDEDGTRDWPVQFGLGHGMVQGARGKTKRKRPGTHQGLALGGRNHEPGRHEHRRQTPEKHCRGNGHCSDEDVLFDHLSTKVGTLPAASPTKAANCLLQLIFSQPRSVACLWWSASIIKEIPLSEMDEGDVMIHNDPFRGGMHTPEHTLIKPVFFEGDFFGFSVAIGHIAEVGGMVPGGFPRRSDRSLSGRTAGSSSQNPGEGQGRFRPFGKSCSPTTAHPARTTATSGR